MFVVKRIADRDDITGGIRTIGDICYVSETGQTFVLDGGVTNDDWRLPTNITFDDTIEMVVSGAGGTTTEEIEVASIKNGIMQVVQLAITAGTSADTTIELYDDDPSGAGVLIYQVVNLDIVADGTHYDPNNWWAELAARGSLWAKITNDGIGETTYDLRIRLKDDNSEIVTLPPVGPGPV